MHIFQPDPTPEEVAQVQRMAVGHLVDNSSAYENILPETHCRFPSPAGDPYDDMNDLMLSIREQYDPTPLSLLDPVPLNLIYLHETIDLVLQESVLTS